MPAEVISPPGPTGPSPACSREYVRPADHVVSYVVCSTPADAVPLLRDISAYPAYAANGVKPHRDPDTEDEPAQDEDEPPGPTSDARPLTDQAD